MPRKCLRSTIMLVVVISCSLSPSINAAPPPQQTEELRRVVRTPEENTARKFQSQVTSNPNLNYLKVEPQDLQVNQGDLSTFSVFLT